MIHIFQYDSYGGTFASNWKRFTIVSPHPDGVRRRTLRYGAIDDHTWSSFEAWTLDANTLTQFKLEIIL
jgi:hypothetical protein